MIILKYPKGFDQLTDWKSRLERMTVPHLLIENSSPQPSIKENEKTEVVGIEGINIFLDQYERDLKAWNQDRCDMWIFDAEG